MSLCPKSQQHECKGRGDGWWPVAWLLAVVWPLAVAGAPQARARSTHNNKLGAPAGGEKGMMANLGRDPGTVN
jgi:hypothetical protein